MDVLEITRITRKTIEFTVPAELGDTVSVAMLQKRHGPNGLTTWQAVDSFDAGTRVASIVVAGPDADPTGALVVSGSAGDLWAADLTNPSIDAARIMRFRVQDGTVGSDVPASAVDQLTAALALKADIDDARFTDARVPTGGAGGFLSGEFPDPGVNDAALVAAMAGHVGDGSAFDLAQRAAFGSVGVDLSMHGLTVASNLTGVLNAAIAAGARHIVIPYRAAPWAMTSQFTYAGSDRLTIEWEPGARVTNNMASGLAMDLTNTTLVNASFTSPFTGLTSAADWPNYALPARGVLFRDNCRTEGDYYHEYACSGIQIVGAHCRIMGDATFHGMRQRTGWAEGIHVDGGLGGVYDFVCHGTVTVTDSDRATEIEEGVYDITFAGGGRFTNVYPNGYPGQPTATDVTNGTAPDAGSAYATYTFTIGAHSHSGGGGARNVRYLGEWVLEYCGAGVQFIRSSGTNDADRPRDCYVESVKIRGLALAPGYQAVAIEGYNITVGQVHFTTGSGIAGGLMRVRGYGGANNTVKRITSDDATKNLIRVDVDPGVGTASGGLRAGDMTMPALKSINGKYMALSGPVNATNGALGNNTLRLVPHYVAVPLCIDRIGCEVTVAGEAGSVVRLGIYDDAGGLPGSPIIDATVTAAAIGTPEATIFTVLAPGWYWVGGAIQGAPTTQPTLRSTGSQLTPGYPILADSAATAVQSSPIAHSKGSVSGALPAFGSTLSGTSAAPRVFVRLV